MSSFVKVQGVSHRFSLESSPVLKEINLDFFLGEMVAIVGPDGAGKTTLLRSICSLLLPTEGSVFIDGNSTRSSQELIFSKIGYMSQKFGLYEDLTVLENLNLFASLRNVDKDKIDDIFDSLLKFTSLKPFGHRLVKHLSGGMKQKLGLACALIKKPKVLILDEPSVGVDPLSRRELWSMVRSLLDDQICILWSTTYLDEAEKCDRVVLLNDGIVRYFGTPSNLVESVNGKVFKISNVEDKRSCLKDLIKNHEIIDGVIEGSDLRVITEQKISIDGIERVSPRLEDAFIYLLEKQNVSTLSEISFLKEVKSQSEFPIQATLLSRSFGSFVAVKDVSFEVKKGEVFGLLGPNGAGKSTTFKMLCGLLSPSSGKSLIDGGDAIKSRQKIGYMAQKFCLYGNITVIQNLDFFSSIYCQSFEEKKAALEMAINRLGLFPYLNYICDALPIGIKQKLSFACSILHSPQVLFLDEPTSGMDPISRRAFWRQIHGLASQGCTIMVTTHFMDEAENCDRIALLSEGQIIYLGDSTSLKNQIKSPSNINPTLDDAFVLMMRKYR